MSKDSGSPLPGTDAWNDKYYPETPTYKYEGGEGVGGGGCLTAAIAVIGIPLILVLKLT